MPTIDLDKKHDASNFFRKSPKTWIGKWGQNYTPWPIISWFTRSLAGSWYELFCLNLSCVDVFWVVQGVYIFAKEWVTPPVAMLAAILYSVVPYRIMEIYQHFLFSEFAATAIIPFCFYYLTRICQRENWLDTLLFSFSFGLLILTHIPTTIIAVISFIIYVLVLLEWQRFNRTLIHLIISCGIGLLISCFHWIKIITELEWVTLNNDKFTSDSFNYASWFFPSILIERKIYLFVLASWLLDTMIVLTVLLLIPGLIFLIFKKFGSQNNPYHKLVLALTVTSFFAFFMTTKASSFVWENLPFLEKIQFPWRWVSVLSFLSVMVFILSITSLIKAQKNLTRLYVYPALGLVVSM